MKESDLVRVLRALGDPKRFRMVRELAAAGELSCGQLGRKFALSQPTISHHLKILAGAGLLRVRQDAQLHYVSLDTALLDDAAALLQSRLTSRPTRRKSGLAPNRKPVTASRNKGEKR